MPKPLPVEIRERVVEVVENDGLTIEEAAQRFRVGTASVKRWLRRSRAARLLRTQWEGSAWCGLGSRSASSSLT